MTWHGSIINTLHNAVTTKERNMEKTYEQVIDTVANTMVNVSIDRTAKFGFYLSDAQIAFLFDKDKEVVEMDMQMAKDAVFTRLTRSFA